MIRSFTAERYVYIFQMKNCACPRMVTKDRIADDIKGVYMDDAGLPFDSEDVEKVCCYYYPPPRLISLEDHYART